MLFRSVDEQYKLIEYSKSSPAVSKYTLRRVITDDNDDSTEIEEQKHNASSYLEAVSQYAQRNCVKVINDNNDRTENQEQEQENQNNQQTMTTRRKQIRQPAEERDSSSLRRSGRKKSRQV